MKLATHIVEKPWGRRDIAPAFGDMGGKQVGEIWYDSALGEPLPLLVKWLFTSEKLSIQVHPNDQDAQLRGMASGKEECWIIIDAEPGSAIALGTQSAMTPDQLRGASLSGDIEQIMHWKAVKAGDYFYIPAGTVHAIGAGITLVEVQQNVDITYRLYDYARLDNGKLRELHLDDGVMAAKPVPYVDERCGHVGGNALLAQSDYFSLWHISDQDGLPLLPTDRPLWITPIKGHVNVGDCYGQVGDCLYLPQNQDIIFSDDAHIIVAAQ